MMPPRPPHEKEATHMSDQPATAEELVEDAMKELWVLPCPRCDGSGQVGGIPDSVLYATCQRCGGSGSVVSNDA